MYILSNPNEIARVKQVAQHPKIVFLDTDRYEGKLPALDPMKVK